MELQALQAIYMDDLKELGASPPHFEITIQFLPENSPSENTLVLDVTLPATYPSELPILEVKPQFDLSQQLQQLMTSLIQLAEENRGTVMVFTLASHAKEWLETNWKPPTLEKKEEDESQACDEEEDEEELIEFARLETDSVTTYVQQPLPRPNTPPILEGTPVTPESSAEWRRKNQTSPSSENPTGLTGRQQFEQDASLITSDVNVSDD